MGEVAIRTVQNVAHATGEDIRNVLNVADGLMGQMALAQNVEAPER